MFIYVLQTGSSVVQVKARDADIGSNADIRYRLQKGAFDDFSIDNETGIVYVASKLDYDRRNTYNIEVVATDLGIPSMSGTTLLTINTININDKLPYFVPATQKAEVSSKLHRQINYVHNYRRNNKFV